VFTARVSYGGADRFDVTRKSGGPAGAPFAPSWAILNRARNGLKAAAEMAGHAGSETDARAAQTQGLGVWWRYVGEFLDEMRASFRADRTPWDALLARGEVTLCCFCTDPERCHRTILAALILPKMGAVYCGERA